MLRVISVAPVPSIQYVLVSPRKQAESGCISEPPQPEAEGVCDAERDRAQLLLLPAHPPQHLPALPRGLTTPHCFSFPNITYFLNSLKVLVA